LKKIGLLGCGVMGTQIALAIDSGKIPGLLTHVYDDSKEASITLVSKLKNKPEIVENSHLLSSHSVNIVVEAASQNAVRDDGLSILQNKRDFMIMSVGALLDESIYDILYDACEHFKKTIYLPSGAIAGLDGLKSIKNELESVSITTTKHPRSLKGAKFFETSEINLDPANINVAALVSLSGIGSDSTSVKIIADPNTDKNTHHIEAIGKSGKMTFTIENTPDPENPKTSRLAILSAIETLRQYCSDDIQIGT
jgi:aspartate dehydrogenase